MTPLLLVAILVNGQLVPDLIVTMADSPILNTDRRWFTEAKPEEQLPFEAKSPTGPVVVVDDSVRNHLFGDPLLLAMVNAHTDSRQFNLDDVPSEQRKRLAERLEKQMQLKPGLDCSQVNVELCQYRQAKIQVNGRDFSMHFGEFPSQASNDFLNDKPLKVSDTQRNEKTIAERPVDRITIAFSPRYDRTNEYGVYQKIGRRLDIQLAAWNDLAQTNLTAIFDKMSKDHQDPDGVTNAGRRWDDLPPKVQKELRDQFVNSWQANGYDSEGAASKAWAGMKYRGMDQSLCLYVGTQESDGSRVLRGVRVGPRVGT
jgi:hypothetical protein